MSNENWPTLVNAVGSGPVNIRILTTKKRRGLQVDDKPIPSVLPLQEVMPGCNSHEKDAKH
jgi:hypothetical protein